MWKSLPFAAVMAVFAYASLPSSTSAAPSCVPGAPNNAVFIDGKKLPSCNPQYDSNVHTSRKVGIVSSPRAAEEDESIQYSYKGTEVEVDKLYPPLTADTLKQKCGVTVRTNVHFADPAMENLVRSEGPAYVVYGNVIKDSDQLPIWDNIFIRVYWWLGQYSDACSLIQYRFNTNGYDWIEMTPVPNAPLL